LECGRDKREHRRAGARLRRGRDVLEDEPPRGCQPLGSGCPENRRIHWPGRSWRELGGTQGPDRQPRSDVSGVPHGVPRTVRRRLVPHQDKRQPVAEISEPQRSEPQRSQNSTTEITKATKIRKATKVTRATRILNDPQQI